MNEFFFSLVKRTVPVLPVIQVERADDIIELSEALVDGGITALEITLRTAAGLEAIRLARKHFPEAVVCAGTVTSAAQLHEAVDAGAECVVTPGISEALVTAAVDSDTPLLPGIATPSELMLGLEAGLQHFKLFPAEIVGGIGMLKALGGPFPTVKFCPTGGLNAARYQEYLALPNVFCGGGSWMIVKERGKFRPDATTKAAQLIAQCLSN